MSRPRVFLDVTIDDQPVGRVIFELFSERVPKTCENFRALCTGERGVSKRTGQPLYYKNSTFHRSIAGFMIQGGDINGSGGESVYDGAPHFPDEDLDEALSEPGLLCMANKGPNTNASQFFITLAPCEHLNGKHVVFGKVIRGYTEVVQRMAQVPVGAKSQPEVPLVISNCGELELRKKLVSDPGHGEDVDQGRKRRRKNRSRSRSKDRTKDQKKSRRKRSLTPEPQLGRAVEETEEEYDARLEREEKERIAARKLRDLEALRNRHEDGPVTEGTVRFKGRGRMRYVDPEMRNEGRGD